LPPLTRLIFSYDVHDRRLLAKVASPTSDYNHQLEVAMVGDNGDEGQLAAVVKSTAFEADPLVARLRWQGAAAHRVYGWTLKITDMLDSGATVTTRPQYTHVSFTVDGAYLARADGTLERRGDKVSAHCTVADQRGTIVLLEANGDVSLPKSSAYAVAGVRDKRWRVSFSHSLAEKKSQLEVISDDRRLMSLDLSLGSGSDQAQTMNLKAEALGQSVEVKGQVLGDQVTATATKGGQLLAEVQLQRKRLDGGHHQVVGKASVRWGGEMQEYAFNCKSEAEVESDERATSVYFAEVEQNGVSLSARLELKVDGGKLSARHAVLKKIAATREVMRVLTVTAEKDLGNEYNLSFVVGQHGNARGEIFLSLADTPKGNATLNVKGKEMKLTIDLGDDGRLEATVKEGDNSASVRVRRDSVEADFFGGHVGGRVSTAGDGASFLLRAGGDDVHAAAYGFRDGVASVSLESPWLPHGRVAAEANVVADRAAIHVASGFAHDLVAHVDASVTLSGVEQSLIVAANTPFDGFRDVSLSAEAHQDVGKRAFGATVRQEGRERRVGVSVEEEEDVNGLEVHMPFDDLKHFSLRREKRQVDGEERFLFQMDGRDNLLALGLRLKDGQEVQARVEAPFIVDGGYTHAEVLARLQPSESGDGGGEFSCTASMIKEGTGEEDTILRISAFTDLSATVELNVATPLTNVSVNFDRDPNWRSFNLETVIDGKASTLTAQADVEGALRTYTVEFDTEMTCDELSYVLHAKVQPGSVESGLTRNGLKIAKLEALNLDAQKSLKIDFTWEDCFFDLLATFEGKTNTDAKAVLSAKSSHPKLEKFYFSYIIDTEQDGRKTTVNAKQSLVYNDYYNNMTNVAVETPTDTFMTTSTSTNLPWLGFRY